MVANVQSTLVNKTSEHQIADKENSCSPDERTIKQKNSMVYAINYNGKISQLVS